MPAEEGRIDSMKRIEHRIPELMSPAGHWPQLHAAIEAGADAVYFGLQHFSARAKVGFTLAELPDVMRTLHRRQVRGYVTFNTLVFDHELDQAADAIEQIARSGCDAVIVQDVGVARMVRQIAPDLEIHGSTQMSITSAEGAELARRWGCRRVVLGRELSLDDIRRIAAATDVELEVFVHGALCVSYSGQCFSSEAWGGRSANRGQCAQACRLSYDLVVDGQPVDLGADRYLLSPGDLYALNQVPELAQTGVACLKIEGRYKDAEYVAMTTSAYRQALDAVAAGRDVAAVDTAMRDSLEQIYSRGLGPHFISGTNHQTVVSARAPRHRGLKIGVVQQVRGQRVVIRTEPDRTIKAGDGIVFDAADRVSPDVPEQGGRVWGVQTNDDGTITIEFGRGEIDLQRVTAGDWVWRTDDPQLKRAWRAFAESPVPKFRRPVDLHVVLRTGQPLQIRASLSNGVAVDYTTRESVAPARNRPTDRERLALQLGRLGDTPFELGELTVDSDDRSFVPASVLNEARRELVEMLLQEPQTPRKIDVRPWQQASVELPGTEAQVADRERPLSEVRPQMHLLVRTARQLDGAIELRPDSVTLDYLELYGLRDSVEKLRGHDIAVRVASPRILKPSEQKVIRFLMSLECPILVRSGGLLHALLQEPEQQRPELHGDFSLNAANVLAMQEFLSLGLSRVTPTHDLNAGQIVDLAAGIRPDCLEIVAFQHLPVFHTEHCVFCRFLSDGTDHTNCGHPCERHEIAVQDAQGRRHPVMADVGCRNTVFGAEAQSAAPFMHRMLRAGIVHYRLEFVHQTAEQVQAIATAMRRFLLGEVSATELDRIWQTVTPHGTTSGSLFTPRNFKTLVQLS